MRRFNGAFRAFPCHDCDGFMVSPALLRRWPLIVVLLGLLLSSEPAEAQVGGVDIDTEGVLRIDYARRESATLARKRMEAFADERLPDEVGPFTEMRKVSLRAIERELQQAGSVEEVSEAAQFLYGLQRVDYIFADEEASDIVLAGPAEGFAPDTSGRMIGLTTGRPPIRLEDLLVALRWGRRSGGRGQIGCSIDPEPQRLQDLQNWLQANSTAASRNVARSRYSVMARILGLQNVSVFEVPDDSHFAQVLVEADFRMKLIALGKENPGVRGLRSHLSLISPQGNSLQRWWFVPLYEPIEVDDAGLAFHLSGQRAQLLAQDEWTDGQGRRSDAAFTRASTQKFAQLFTEHFSELADKSPVFAELQSVFDLALLAALLEQEDLPRRVDWRMTALLDGDRHPVGRYPVPKYIESSATTTNRARSVLGLVGGVTLAPGRVVGRGSERRQTAELAAVRHAATSGSSGSQGASFWDE